MSEATTIRMQRCLDRLRAGDPAARRDLLGIASVRLRRLARKMLRADGRLRRWVESGDVLNDAVLRLSRALEAVAPETPREFFRLAALQVRRELVDLGRHHFGPCGAAAHHQSIPPQEGIPGGAPAAADSPDCRDEPSALAAWAEMHEKAGALPEQQRETFDLVYYQGLSHAEVAALLGVSTKTVQRRWHAACLALHELMGGELPDL
jgi:RNA polymerase sigma-70 factor (ECF subfamily)